MLILARGEQEMVQIGFGELAGYVRVIKVRGNKVWLGFDFPKHVAVNRIEVVARIEAALPKVEVEAT